MGGGNTNFSTAPQPPQQAQSSTASTFVAVNEPISLTALTELNAVPHSLPSQQLVMASLKAPKYQATGRRAPIDVVAVVDRSGSMSGTKLNLVKETLQFIIEQLTPSDRLSIVTYDDTVTKIMGLTQMNEAGKSSALTKVQSIRPGGSTNLSGGLQEGIQEMLNRRTFNDVSSVLLFTDGLANIGLTNSAAIVSMMRTKMSAQSSSTWSSIPVINSLFGSSAPVHNANFTINTFGFGKDHDATMLRSISEAGSGMYYHIESANAIAEAFIDCLGGLMSVVAQQITLKARLQPGVVVTRIHTKFPNRTLGNNEYEVTIPDLQSEERRDILFAVTLPSTQFEAIAFPIVEFTVQYKDVRVGSIMNMSTTATIARPAVMTGAPITNREVDIQRNRVLAAEAMDEAQTLGNARNLVEANQRIDNAITIIQNSISASDPFCTGLIADLRKIREGLRDTHSYSTVGAQMLSNNMMSHYQQRSSNVGYAAQSAYQNETRGALRKAWSDKKNVHFS